ncbi:MAG: hypothetical protein ACOH1T_03325 [Microbacteriaceae bacterium]
MRMASSHARSPACARCVVSALCCGRIGPSGRPCDSWWKPCAPKPPVSRASTRHSPPSGVLLRRSSPSSRRKDVRDPVELLDQTLEVCKREAVASVHSATATASFLRTP